MNVFYSLVTLNSGNLLESIYQSMIQGENFMMTDTGAAFENVGNSWLDFFKTIFDSFDNIVECSDFEINSANPFEWFKLTYEIDTYNEEYYFNYLKTEYIPKMPEFKKYLKGLEKDSIDYNRKIDNIIKRIKEIRDDYEEYFGGSSKSADFYSDEYSGLVRPSLVSELVKPVNPPSGSTITFSGKYSYGTLGNGLQQQGIEINKNTTGNDEGDPVYSIYHHGKVEESTYDNTFTNSDYKGGSVKISYEASLSDGNYRFYATYSGLDPSSLTLSKGDIVEQNQVIGKIGSASDSNTDVPSLFFSMYN